MDSQEQLKKERIKALSIIPVLALLGLIVAQFAPSAFDRQYTTFETYQELEASGSIEQGWLPSFLPRSLRDIRESRYLDSHKVEMYFNYDIGDTRSLESHCASIEKRELGTTYQCKEHQSVYAITLYNDGSGALYLR